MKIQFGGHTFLLDASGILYWPEKSLLVVSDLHLEKASHFAKRGYFLPPYDSHETLERLHKTIAALAPKQILILGDCFHDAKGHSRLAAKERALFENLLPYNPLWIIGNHDGDFVPDGFMAHEAYAVDGIVFRHEATKEPGFEISGHYHPKVEIEHKGAIITRPCFVEDGAKLILPAFGAYTGGLSVAHPPLADIIGSAFRIYPLGQTRVYALSRGSQGAA